MLDGACWIALADLVQVYTSLKAYRRVLAISSSTTASVGRLVLFLGAGRGLASMYLLAILPAVYREVSFAPHSVYITRRILHLYTHNTYTCTAHAHTNLHLRCSKIDRKRHMRACMRTYMIHTETCVHD